MKNKLLNINTPDIHNISFNDFYNIFIKAHYNESDYFIKIGRKYRGIQKIKLTKGRLYNWDLTLLEWTI